MNEEGHKDVEKQKRAEAALTVAVIILSATALFGGTYLFAIYTGLITWWAYLNYVYGNKKPESMGDVFRVEFI